MWSFQEQQIPETYSYVPLMVVESVVVSKVNWFSNSIGLHVDILSRYDKTSLFKKSGTIVAGAISARDVLSQVSSPRVRGLTAVSGQPENLADSTEPTSTPTMRLRNKISTLKVELSDASGITDVVQSRLANLIETAEGIAGTAPLCDGLKSLRVSLTSSNDAMKKPIKVVEDLGDTDLSGLSSQSSRVDPAAKEKKENETIITVESVPVAVRRLDFGGEALSGEGNDGDGGRTGPSFSRNTIRSGLGGRQRGPFYVCNGPHLARENPSCKEALERRQASTGGKVKVQRKGPVPEAKELLSPILLGDLKINVQDPPLRC